MRKAILPLLAMLAACDGGAPDGEARSIRVTGTSDYEAQLNALSDFNRGLGLRRAITESGGRCKSVDASGYQRDYKTMSMWTVRCSDSGDWALFIAPNGDVQVRKCSDAAQLKLPECRVAAPATPPRPAP